MLKEALPDKGQSRLQLVQLAGGQDRPDLYVC
jgi:hypothetical protein